jgi:hypothetical protein
MDLFWLDKKLSHIPSGNTIGQIKQHIKKWLDQQNIKYTLEMVLTNGTMIDPVIFNSNLYDDVVIGDLKGKITIYPQNNNEPINNETINNETINNETINNEPMELLDKNLLYEILLNLPIKDMIHMCQTSVKLQNICRENELWRRRMMIDYNIIDKPLEISWRTYYIKKYLNIPDFYIESEMDLILDVPAIEISIAVKSNDYDSLVNIDNFQWNDDFIETLINMAHYLVSREIIKYLLLKMEDPRKIDIEFLGPKFDEIGIDWIKLENKINEYTVKYGVNSAVGAREAVRHFFNE